MILSSTKYVFQVKSKWMLFLCEIQVAEFTVQVLVHKIIVHLDINS